MSMRYDIGSAGATGPVWQGTDIALRFALRAQDRQDVTNWSTALSFKRNRNDNLYILQYTVPTLLDPLGVWQFNIAKASTLLFSAAGTYWYDFKRTDGGSATILTWGIFQVDVPTNQS